MKQVSIAVILIIGCISVLGWASTQSDGKPLPVEIVVPTENGAKKLTHIFYVRDTYKPGTKINVVSIETHNVGYNPNWRTTPTKWIKTGTKFEISAVPVQLDAAPDGMGVKRIANYTATVLVDK